MPLCLRVSPETAAMRDGAWMTETKARGKGLGPQWTAGVSEFRTLATVLQLFKNDNSGRPSIERGKERETDRCYCYIDYIHPSVFYIHLFCSMSRGAGAYPSMHWLRGRVEPWQLSIQSITRKTHLDKHYSEFPAHLTCRYWTLCFLTLNQPPARYFFINHL